MGLRFCALYKQSKSQSKWQSSTAAGTKGKFPNYPGKNRADQEGKKAALLSIRETALIPSLITSTVVPRYSTPEVTWAQDQRGTKGEDGWWHTDQKLPVTLSEQWKIAKGLHDSLCLGRNAMSSIVFWLLQKRTLRCNNEGYSSLRPLCQSQSRKQPQASSPSC